ncbi:hypothetical protein QBC46DRAFT_377787 [Diplogelasinospora grovesii]|uniref:Uncharacterized protein n=1 Tax=Diplogelasinospora grovesii TaxID=303347 RepID=A0AAN6S7M2_9PEZI|nr:hypothetical protein QBC46DRAFT_377787 [Diplogelasinospora grovesii]
MRSSQGPTTADLNDTRHPNDVGYQKMAVVWNQGISEALSKGYITNPAENGIPADGEVQKQSQLGANSMSVTSDSVLYAPLVGTAAVVAVLAMVVGL